MKKGKLYVAFYAMLLFICVCCQNDELNSKRMFSNNASFYLNKPIKNILLDSKYKLKHYSFAEADSYFYLDGIFLTFSNDVKIFVGIEDFRFQAKRRQDRVWDINKCILERASEIKLVTDKPLHYKQFKQNVTIEFIAKDSIVVRDDFYDFYRDKFDSLQAKE